MLLPLSGPRSIRVVQLHPRILQPMITALDDTRGDGSGKGVVQKAISEAVTHLQEMGTGSLFQGKIQTHFIGQCHTRAGYPMP